MVRVQPDLSFWSISHSFPEDADSHSAVETDPQPATSPAPLSGRVALGVALRSAQMLVKKLPDIVDQNPVKIALGLVKAAIEVKEVRHHQFSNLTADQISS